MDDPKEGGLLTPEGAAGLPTGSVRDISYAAFLSLHFDLTIVLSIYPQTRNPKNP